MRLTDAAGNQIFWDSTKLNTSNFQSSIRVFFPTASSSSSATVSGSDLSDFVFGTDLTNDTLSSGKGDDYLYSGSGNDSLDGGAGNDELVGGAGNDSLNGGAGVDCADYTAVKAALTVNLATGTATGDGTDKLVDIENACAGSGNDTLTGSTGANDLEGGAGNDVIDAGNGDDSLLGGVGNDSLLGGAGNDELTGGAGNDTLVGGAGVDCANYEAVTAALSVNLATGTATGDGTDRLVDIENVCAGSGNDTLTGSTGANDLEGGVGNDFIDAASGNDTLLGGLGNDALLGGAGNDTLTGCIEGLYGGRGEVDTLTGGAGADIFTLAWSGGRLYGNGNASNAGRADYALISDFTVGEDKLQLRSDASGYRLAVSGVSGVSGTGLYAIQQGGTDELIAIIRSSNGTSLTADNTINKAVFV